MKYFKDDRIIGSQEKNMLMMIISEKEGRAQEKEKGEDDRSVLRANTKLKENHKRMCEGFIVFTPDLFEGQLCKSII